MKKIYLSVLVLFTISFNAFSQEFASGPYYKNESQAASKFFLGFGSGINNYLGLIGPSAECQVASKFTLFGGAGLGSWGNKVSFGGRFYKNYPSNWAFGVGMSHSSGLEKLEVSMPSQYIVGASSNVTVPVKLKSANTLNISATRYWLMGSRRRNRFNLEIGYAAMVAAKQFELLDKRYQLTGQGIDFMNTLQPGGLNLGLGFSFGL